MRQRKNIKNRTKYLHFHNPPFQKADKGGIISEPWFPKKKLKLN